ncbi:chorismate mutase [candidate division WOR-1 bacterium RIFCSPLOWO2_12_FULL_45_9]|uniref:chorismate mutase n=1 Tax=candidate division WOR-1 bacterium RIFCSPLOWO2_12_FULL_45_9 TaxID=1802568 RepID=A0A1F4RPD6_UNCSA|nr:MAG: chorismate mutase [candidate division WOR-1 bacterium RIFCSPLOWO2_12_FULL_45_9]
MRIRGIRGATTAAENTREEIVAATKELLTELIKANQLKIEEIASIIFSATRDLSAEFPAVAARELGWNDTSLLCTSEIDVPGSLARCIRILMQVNTDKPQKEIKNIYLKEAVNLRR